MRRLTVVQLLPALVSGGVERSTIEVASALVRAGHRALVVSAGGRLVPALEAAGAEHVVLNIGRKSPLTLRHAGTLRRLFAERGADIVHARSRLPAWIGWRALRGMPTASRPRFVTTVHGLNSPSRYSAIMARGERVICVSEVVRKYVLDHYPQTDERLVRVIPRGIDPVAFPRRQAVDRAARARLARTIPQIGGDGPLLLMPGRGTRLKGHHDALALPRGLRTSGVDARLWMPGAVEAGRERYIEELRQAAGNTLHAVAMTGPITGVAEAYRASDLVLQLSRKPEAFGRTVLESLASGCPVVGWDHGGVGELLHEFQPDGAVPVFDEYALLHRSSGLLAHPSTLPVSMPHTLAAMQSATLSVYAEFEGI